MTYQKSLKYNILGFKRSVTVFYIIIILILLFGLVSIIRITNGNSSGSIGGMEITTAIFVFVLGLNSFKDRLLMMMQNGVSRKTFYLSSITSFVILCFFMSVIDRVILLLGKYAVSFFDRVSFSSFFEYLYNDKIAGMSAGIINLEGFLFSLCLYLAAAAIGFFITISYYRMNKSLKILISVGVPVSLFVVLPTVNELVYGRVSHAIGRALDFAMGISAQNPFHAMVTFLLTFVVFSGLSWLLTRKVTVRSN